MLTFEKQESISLWSRHTSPTWKNIDIEIIKFIHTESLNKYNISFSNCTKTLIEVCLMVRNPHRTCGNVIYTTQGRFYKCSLKGRLKDSSHLN